MELARQRLSFFLSPSSFGPPFSHPFSKKRASRILRVRGRNKQSRWKILNRIAYSINTWRLLRHIVCRAFAWAGRVLSAQLDIHATKENAQTKHATHTTVRPCCRRARHHSARGIIECCMLSIVPRGNKQTDLLPPRDEPEDPTSLSGRVHCQIASRARATTRGKAELTAILINFSVTVSRRDQLQLMPFIFIYNRYRKIGWCQCGEYRLVFFAEQLPAYTCIYVHVAKMHFLLKL